jgi:hypothetical protein
MSARLAVEALQLARAAGFPCLALTPGDTVAHGPRPWRRFLDRAGNADLRAALVALDHLHYSSQTAGPPGGATEKETDR